jgi:hypothetical protein
MADDISDLSEQIQRMASRIAQQIFVDMTEKLMAETVQAFEGANLTVDERRQLLTSTDGVWHPRFTEREQMKIRILFAMAIEYQMFQG